jgi:YidC/Oxa1 family membrane protein insertase
MRETETAQSIAAIPIEQRPILAYAEDDYTWNQLGPYLEAVMGNHGRPVIYVTSDPEDPRIKNHDGLMSVFYIRDTLAQFLPKVDSPVFLTTMPDLDSFHIKRPKTSTCVYAFHSITSIHMVYRPGAFDAYDVFFCIGPHHKEELTEYFQQRGRSDVDLREVGYPKLDRIAATYRTYEKQHPNVQTILIAPSWGPDNALASGGAGLIEELSGAGYRVVVRPHPAFFESIYPEGERIIADLQAQFAGDENVVFETSITSENSFMEADLMVSDWSGASFEYALGTERPVLFIDLPPKATNPDWQQFGTVPFEDRMRQEVGTVVEPGNPAAAVEAVQELLADPLGYRDRIVEIRTNAIYNFGTAAQAGASVLDELARRAGDSQ